MPRHLMVPEDLLLLRWPQDAQPSPDGSRVAWCEAAPDAERDEPVTRIMVAPADASEPPRPFTPGPHDFSPRWSPDGRHVAFLSANDGPPALHLARLDGGTPAKVETPGPVSWIEWSPGGDRLVLVVNVTDKSGDAPRPRERNSGRVVRGIFNRIDGAGWFDGRNHLFVHEIGSGVVRQLTSGEFDHSQPSWSPDGTTIVFLSDRSRRHDDRLPAQDLWTIGESGGRRRRLTEGLGGASFPTYSPDGSRVAFTGVVGLEERAARDGHLFVVGADGKGEPERVAPKLDRPVGVTFATKPFAWLSADELIFTVADAGTVGISRSRLGAAGARAVVAGDAQVSGAAVASAGRRRLLAYVSGWVDAPGEVYCLELGGGSASPVKVSTAGDDLLRSVELLPSERLRTRAADGLELEYFAIRPRRASGSRSSRGAPPFLEIHGGPNLYNPIYECFPTYQMLAGAGYLVVMPNPRGSIGYGEEFRRRVVGDWGGADFGDVTACLDDAIERLDGDPRRQFLGGYSYGGFMSAWTVGHTDRFKAACIGAPVIDNVSHFGTSDVGVFFTEAMMADPWSPPDELRSRSPLSYAGHVSTPVFLYVNEGDLRCPPSQADEFYVGLKIHGKEVEYVRYPGGSHLSFLPMLGAPSQCEDRSRRILDFLGRHGGTPAGRAPRAAKQRGRP